MYMPFDSNDLRRYDIRRYHELSPPIIFEVEHPCEWGICLADALESRTGRLVGGDEPMAVFQECGPTLFLRLEVSS
jgi:hypothetical protein